VLTGTGTEKICHGPDLTAKVVLDVHTTVPPGHACMWPAEFIDAAGDNDDPSLFYARVEHKL
jgi:hypothetical protein